MALVDALAAEGIALEHVDLGGGLGIRYRDESPVPVAEYAALLRELFRGRRETLLLEPGRSLVAEAGVLLTRVTYLKPGPARNFAIVDAAMNDLLRPALYDAWHPVEPVRPRDDAPRTWDIVGPVCEIGGLPRARTRPRPRPRRPPRGARRRRVRDGDELELQRPPARLRGDGGRRSRAPDPAPRDARRSDRARVVAAVTARARTREIAAFRALRACANTQQSRRNPLTRRSEILQIVEMCLECRQQVQVDLSRGS